MLLPVNSGTGPPVREVTFLAICTGAATTGIKVAAAAAKDAAEAAKPEKASCCTDTTASSGNGGSSVTSNTSTSNISDTLGATAAPSTAATAASAAADGECGDLKNSETEAPASLAELQLNEEQKEERLEEHMLPPSSEPCADNQLCRNSRSSSANSNFHGCRLAVFSGLDATGRLEDGGISFFHVGACVNAAFFADFWPVLVLLLVLWFQPSLLVHLLDILTVFALADVNLFVCSLLAGRGVWERHQVHWGASASLQQHHGQQEDWQQKEEQQERSSQTWVYQASCDSLFCFSAVSVGGSSKHRTRSCIRSPRKRFH